MARVARLIGSGMAPLAAQEIIGRVDSAVTATGSVITDAYDVVATITLVTTTGSGTGVQLPTGSLPGDLFFVSNLGANTLSVYPGTATAKIDGGSAGAAYSVGTLKGAFFVCNNTDGASYTAVLSA